MKMTALEKEAIAWWRMHRPWGWSLTEHIASPTVNTTHRCEHRLAEEVAKFVEHRRKPRRKSK